MDLVIVYAIAFVGLTFVIPTCYVILARRYRELSSTHILLISFGIWAAIAVKSFFLITQTSPQHFFVVLAAITALSWVVLLHHLELIGATYTQYVHWLLSGYQSKSLGIVKRNCYYLLFVLMLLRGNFYCGANQFYRIFGMSLKPYHIRAELDGWIRVNDFGVMSQRTHREDQIQVPAIRWITAYNFTEKHTILPFQAVLDRATGLQILINIVSKPGVHWLKLLFKP